MSVIDQFQVAVLELINLSHIRINFQNWIWMWNSFQLLLQRLHVIFVNMSITQNMHEFSTFEASYLRQKTSQQTVARNVERHTQTQIT